MSKIRHRTEQWAEIPKNDDTDKATQRNLPCEEIHSVSFVVKPHSHVEASYSPDISQLVTSQRVKRCKLRS